MGITPPAAGPSTPQPGPIDAAIAGAAPAAAPITAAIAAAPGPWLLLQNLADGHISAGIVGGIFASGVVGKIEDWFRDNYGPSTGP